jgi:NAD(P)-dependent dehydrogenase (short-subunit alcohol dehydrogenase family)
MRLKDKVIVVNGGTKGIGEGIVRLCAAEGARVILSGRSVDEGEALAADIRSKGQKAIFFRADTSKADECIALIDRTFETGGRIDGLVNNAGIFPHVPLLDTDENLFEKVMAVNVKGPFFTTQRSLKYMIQQRSGAIVNVGSTHWQVGPKDMPAYAVSKGALKTLTENVALHYIKEGIRCSWITVGWVITPGEIDKFKRQGIDDTKIEEIASKTIPSGKMQTPEDIAYACVFLLSDESLQVTGADIKVTGGFHSP